MSPRKAKAKQPVLPPVRKFRIADYLMFEDVRFMVVDILDDGYVAVCVDNGTKLLFPKYSVAFFEFSTEPSLIRVINH